MRPLSLTAAAALGLALALTACSEKDAPDEPERIVLTPVAEGAGQAAGNPVGDGTRARVAGYRLEAVRLPPADGPGSYSFRITDRTGAAVTDYEMEQTKLLHLYVVRDDLGAFRHLHPELDDDGTWRGRVDLGTPGRWRVVVEFVPKPGSVDGRRSERPSGGVLPRRRSDDVLVRPSSDANAGRAPAEGRAVGGHPRIQAQGGERPIVLGTTVRVPGTWTPEQPPLGDEAKTADDGVVRVRLLTDGTVGTNGRLRLGISSVEGEPVQLGSYLGATAHLTGFAVGTRGFAHVHPLGAPDITDDETVLTFHTAFASAGDYRMFVQVRVDGLLHQLAVTVPVTE